MLFSLLELLLGTATCLVVVGMLQLTGAALWQTGLTWSHFTTYDHSI